MLFLHFILFQLYSKYCKKVQEKKILFYCIFDQIGEHKRLFIVWTVVYMLTS